VSTGDWLERSLSQVWDCEGIVEVEIFCVLGVVGLLRAREKKLGIVLC